MLFFKQKFTFSYAQSLECSLIALYSIRIRTGENSMVQQIDAPLREDVRLLGNLLGETLKQHAGQELFNQIEQIRALAKGARDGQAEAEKQLEQLFLELSLIF